MTSVMLAGFHEPALLLDEAGGGFGSARGDGVIGGAAEEGDGFIAVEVAEFFAAHGFHGFSGVLPGFDPAFSAGDLLRGPIFQG